MTVYLTEGHRSLISLRTVDIGLAVMLILFCCTC